MKHSCLYAKQKTKNTKNKKTQNHGLCTEEGVANAPTEKTGAARES